MSTEPSTDDRSRTQFEDHPRLQRSTLAQGTSLAGRYRVERLIGEGGMGDVYLATHLLIDKPVAVKVLAPEQMRRTRTVTRFLQEAKAASKIRHPHVVDITDFGESDGCAFFVMEYLEGEDLDRLLKREGRIPWERARHILVQLLEALAAAHQADIVHRDIKPHNCFLTPTPHNPNFVKVIDFGIAKLRTEGSGEQLTRTGAIMGTAEYMSPEQGLGEEIDGRSDLYSVGVILYRMLTGQVPFAGANPMAILYQHIHGELVPPSKAAPDAGIGRQVDDLVMRALSKNRDERFPTAAAFIEALQSIDDVGAGTEPAPRKRGVVYGVSGLFAAGVLALVATFAWQGSSDSDATSASGSANAIASAPKASAEVSDANARDGETNDAPGPGEPAPVPAPSNAAPTPVPSDEPTPPTAINADEPPSAAPPDPADAPIVSATEVSDSEAPDAADQNAPDAKPERSIPNRRSSRALRAGLSSVSGKVSACGKKAGLFPGEKVTVEVRIGTDGKVTSAQVKGSFSSAGASCIEKAVRSATFGPAAKPQSHNHAFDI